MTTRRDFLAASAGTVLSSFGFNGLAWADEVDRSKLANELRVNSYGGSWQENMAKAAFKPFEEVFGVRIVEESHGNEEQLLAKMRAAGPGQYDVVTLNESGLYVGVKQGVFEELRMENIPNYDNLIPKLKEPPYDPGPGIHSVPDIYGSVGLSYNTEHVEDTDSWGALWDEAYSGRIACRDSAIYRMFITALYLGQDPNNISDVGAVYDALKEQRDVVFKYWGGVSECQALLANREAWAADFLGGRSVVLQDQGEPIAYVLPKEGARGFVDCVAIGKGSEKRYTAEVFLNFLLDVEVATKLAEFTKYPHCLDARKVEATEEIKRLPAYDPSGTLSSVVFTDYEYMEANRKEWEKNWTRIKVGG